MRAYLRTTPIPLSVRQEARARHHATASLAEKPKAPEGHNPLAEVTGKVGDDSCANAHASVLNRATGSQPSRAARSLLQLQRQYGNRYVQRVLAAAREGNGEAEAVPEKVAIHPSALQRKCDACEENKVKHHTERNNFQAKEEIIFDTIFSSLSHPQNDLSKGKCPTPKAAPIKFPIGKRSAADIATWGACKWGGTKPDPLQVETMTCKDGSDWRLRVVKVKSRIRTHSRLLAGQSEPTTANATAANFCDQVTELNSLGTCTGKWYMLAAVKAHENVHIEEWKSSFPTDWLALKTAIEGISVPASGATKNKKAATTSMRGSATFTNALLTDNASGNFPTFWGIADPNANTDAAEHAVVDPRIEAICKHAKTKGWAPGGCAVCSGKGIT
jgi:hypothetical protein